MCPSFQILKSLHGYSIPLLYVCSTWTATPNSPLLLHNRLMFFGFFYCFICSCSLLATTSADGTCKIWSTADFNLRNTLKKNSEKWVWDCAFSSDSQYIFTGEYSSLSFHLLPTPIFSRADNLFPSFAHLFTLCTHAHTLLTTQRLVTMWLDCGRLIVQIQ